MNDELNKVNNDIIFFFLSLVSAIISFYIINEKKRSILNYSVNQDFVNNLYKNNRLLKVIINVYFVLNAYNSFQEDSLNNNITKDSQLLLIASTLALLSSLFYLPLGNSNVIINQ